MSNRPDSQSVRRIVLPSGRKIELVRPLTEPSSPAEGLHVCPECRSELVQPVQWRASSRGTWELTLECPNCRWHAEGVFEPDQVEAFEEYLDKGLATLLADLRRLSRANMSEEIERFVTAMQADWILPEDF
jgi:hypothetical protein